jgi:hypothetical protein
MMLDADAIAELEMRLRQMDAQPRSLDLLKLAIETIAASLSVQVEIQMKDSWLSVKNDGADWVVKLKENDYHYFFRERADTWDKHGQCTSKLAWSIMGPRHYLRVRAVAAAAARQKP